MKNTHLGLIWLDSS